MIQHDKMLEWQREREESDRSWREKQASQERQWRQEDAEQAERALGQAQRHHWNELLVLGIFVIVATIFAAFIERGYWWTPPEQKPPTIIIQQVPPDSQI